jgi:hypothetical protein
MTTKTSKVKKSRTTQAATRTAKSLLPIEDDENHHGDVENFVARNRDALNASIRKSRREIAAGKTSSKDVDAIIAEGRKPWLTEY